MKIQMIMNSSPGSNYSECFEKALVERLAHALVGIERTSHPEEATEIARRTASGSADTIVVVGGDGTVNAVLNGILGTKLALGVIPAGSANDLASLYHIPSEVGKACDVIMGRSIHHADLICVNGWYYITAGGLGLGCEIARVANTLRRYRMGRPAGRLLRSKLYLLMALYVLLKNGAHSEKLEVRLNGHSLSADTFSLLVNNQSFLGKHFLVSPGAINDDGLFDVCLIRSGRSLTRMLPALIKVLAGRHLDSPYVMTWRATELIVRAGKPLCFFGDGEIHQESSEFRIRIAPQALDIIVPEFYGRSCQC